MIVPFAAAAAVFHLASPNIFDPDSFYYIRLAWIYRTRGLLDVEFPWMPYSVIKDLSSSLWYGFALFLVPFTYFDDLVVGIKATGVLLTAGALWIYYLVVRRSRLRMAPLWPFLLFFSTPNVLTQFLMVRPQLITLALAPLFFSCLTRSYEASVRSEVGDSTSPAVIPLLSASLAMTWFHLNFAWLLGLIAAVVLAIGWLIERRVAWRSVGAVVAGSFLGWLLRPNPLGAAKLLYVQVVEQGLAKRLGLPLLWGNENLPLTSAALARNFIPFTVLWTAAMLILAGSALAGGTTRSRDQRILLWSSLTLSAAFFLLTVLVGRRSYNLWTEFGIIFIASVFTYVIPSHHVPGSNIFQRAATGIIVGVFLFVAFDSSQKTVASFSHSALPPDRLRSAGLWLREHSQPGDVVFNLRWAHFSSLFFWNQQNYYVAGLDPIFQYAYDPRLYWKFHHLAANESIQSTCGAPVCAREELEGTYEVLVNDFKAKYVVVGQQSHPALYHFFEGDPRFQKTLETPRGEAVYRIEHR